VHPQHQHTKCTPQAEQVSIFRTFFAVLEDLEFELVVLDRLLEATTKKERQLLYGKSAPPGQNPDYAYVLS